MKKLLFISLAIVLALSVGLIGCGEQEEEEEEYPTIVIGGSRSTSGGLEIIGDGAFRPIYETYSEIVNNGDGIVIDGTRFNIELDMRDDHSSPGDLNTNTEDLIADIHAGTVHFLFGPTCTAFLEAQAPLCADGGVVQMTAEGGATKLIPSMTSYNHTFVNLSFSDWYQLPILAKMLGDAGAETAYIAYIDDDHGLEYSGVAEDEFDANGIDTLGFYPMDPLTTVDGDDVIASANTSGADVFCCFAYPDQNIPVTAACFAGYNPAAIVIGPTANFAWYGYMWDDNPAISLALVEGITCFAVGNQHSPQPTAMIDMFDLLETKYGTGILDYWGFPCYWAAMEIWQEACEEVGTVVKVGGVDTFVVDQGDYGDYLRNHHFTTVFGDTWYVSDAALTYPVPADSGALLNYMSHTGEIGQWLDGYVEIVGYEDITDDFPNYKVTEDFEYPMTDKWGWIPG